MESFIQICWLLLNLSIFGFFLFLVSQFYYYIYHKYNRFYAYFLGICILGLLFSNTNSNDEQINFLSNNLRFKTTHTKDINADSTLFTNYKVEIKYGKVNDTSEVIPIQATVKSGNGLHYWGVIPKLDYFYIEKTSIKNQFHYAFQLKFDWKLGSRIFYHNQSSDNLYKGEIYLD